jgi:lysophospholipase L1-like esterase
MNDAPARRRVHSPLPGIALTLSSAIVTLGLLEAGFRLAAWSDDRGTFERAIREPVRPPAGSVAPLGRMIRPSANPRIVYELWPGLDVQFEMEAPGHRRRVRTSRAGFRDRDYAVPKPPGTLRIVGIGDSLMFGWGVDDGEDFLAVLEERLARERPEGPVEILNTAVPGYNTVMEVATLEEKGLPYGPDLVVVGFCPNDASLPNFIRPVRDVFSLRESFLLEFVRSRLRSAPATGDALVLAPRRADNRAFEDEPALVPGRYHALAGWAAFQGALRDLRLLSEKHGFKVLVTAFVPGFDDERKRRGLDLAAREGFPVMDFGEVESRYMRSHGITEYAGSALTVSATDLHPSALAHAMAAEEMVRFLDENPSLTGRTH